MALREILPQGRDRQDRRPSDARRVCKRCTALGLADAAASAGNSRIHHGELFIQLVAARGRIDVMACISEALPAGGQAARTRGELHVHQLAGGGFAEPREHVLEQNEGFALVLVERVALSVGAEADHLAEVFERDEMLAPEMVRGSAGAPSSRSGGRSAEPMSAALAAARSSDGLRDALQDLWSSAMPSSLPQSSTGKSRSKMLRMPSRRLFVSHCSRRHVRGCGGTRDPARPDGGVRPPFPIRRLRHDADALVEDDLALSFMTSSYFRICLRMSKFPRLDLLLSHFEALVHPGVGDRLAFLETQRLQNAVSMPCGRSRRCASDRHRAPSRTSNGRDRPGAETATQLVVDAAAFRGARCHDVEAACFESLLSCLPQQWP